MEQKPRNYPYKHIIGRALQHKMYHVQIPYSQEMYQKQQQMSHF